MVDDRVLIPINLHKGEGWKLEPFKVIEIRGYEDVMIIESENLNGQVKCTLHGQSFDNTQKKMQLVWLRNGSHSIWLDGVWVENPNRPLHP